MRKNPQPVLCKYVNFPAKLTVIIQKDTWTIDKILLLLDSDRLFPCLPFSFYC